MASACQVWGLGVAVGVVAAEREGTAFKGFKDLHLNPSPDSCLGLWRCSGLTLERLAFAIRNPLPSEEGTTEQVARTLT